MQSFFRLKNFEPNYFGHVATGLFLFLHHNRNYDVRREMCLLKKLENGYKCSLCETIYETVAEAVDCECSHHGGPLKVISVHYRSPKQGRHEYPDSIELMMADGTIRTYVSSS